MYRASCCSVYINQRDAQILVNSLYFFVNWLYMFRTIISPSSGARRTGANVPIALYNLFSVGPDDGLMIVRNM